MFGIWRKSTLATVEVSPEVFDAVAAALRASQASHAYVDGAIEMTGITLVRSEEVVPSHPQHRPISNAGAKKNKTNA